MEAKSGREAVLRAENILEELRTMAPPDILRKQIEWVGKAREVIHALLSETRTTKYAQIGGTIFSPGLPVGLVVERAYREHGYLQTPEAEETRKKRIAEFVAALEAPLPAAPAPHPDGCLGGYDLRDGAFSCDRCSEPCATVLEKRAKRRGDAAEILHEVITKMRSESGEADPMHAFSFDASWEELVKRADAVLGITIVEPEGANDGA